MADAVSLEGVTKSFGTRVVLEKTTLIVERAQRLALIGPSGCGKSTLLKMILGLVTPDSGRVKVGDREVTAETSRALRRRIGYVIQDGGLFPHLTAEENVTLVSRLDGRDAKELTPRVKELAELARFPERLLDRFPSSLSGGERQRVGLMRALMLDPDVLLLDEPLGALDPLVRAKLQEDLRGAFRTLKKTVVIVTHDMAEAAYLADVVAVVKDGKILQRAPVADLVAAPAHPFVAELLGAQRTLAEALR
jgi:osmoprotectant transport system ATP-binding protein